VIDQCLSAGTTAFSTQRFDEALKLFLAGSCLEPGAVVFLRNAGATCAVTGQLDPFIRYFERVAKLEPDSGTGFLEAGKAYLVKAEFQQAFDLLSVAFVMSPGHDSEMMYLARAASGLSLVGRSVRLLDRASCIDPSDHHVLSELGRSLREARQFQRGTDALRRAIVLEPNQVGALLTLGFCCLHLGAFAQAWSLYEFRWKDRDFLAENRDSPLQRWTGQPEIRGLRLLVFSEQGFGDTIQFVRFTRELERFGADVTLLVPPGLVRLLGIPPGVSRVVSELASDETFHACCSLMSLPSIFKLTEASIVASRVPYLAAPSRAIEHWKAHIGSATFPRIGVCWSGSDNPRMSHRSLSLKEFSQVFVSGFEFISLNKLVKPSDLGALSELDGRLCHFGDELTDYSVTAGLIDLLDLVVTVDTSVAHLAGAMGKEVWILLPKAADWRWLEDRSDSVWYERVRLFRQDRDADWKSVLDAVAAALITRRKK
jgi:cytochrome c-type biogenesis protein CcmH/NrfG